MLRRSWLRVFVVGGVCAAVVAGGVCAMVVLPASAASGAASAKSKTFSQVLEVPTISTGPSVCTSPSFDLPDNVRCGSSRSLSGSAGRIRPTSRTPV